MSYLGALAVVVLVALVAFFMAGASRGSIIYSFRKIAEHQDLTNSEENIKACIDNIIDERIRMNDIPELVREACKQYLVLEEDLEVEVVETDDAEVDEIDV